MKGEALDCAQVRRRFVAGRVPTGPEVEAHLASCPECRELFKNDAALGRRLGEAAAAPKAEVSELFSVLERDLAQERGLRADLRALSTTARASVLIGIALLLLVGHLLWRPRPNLGVYSPAVFWLSASLLVIALVIGARELLRGPSASRAAAQRERLLAPALLAAPLCAAFFAPLGLAEAAELWGRPGNCFAYGAALSAPLVVLYWLFERRDAPPRAALLGAGALAGIAANLLLHAHCPSAHPGHLLVGHVSVGVLWAALLALSARPLRAQ